MSYECAVCQKDFNSEIARNSHENFCYRTHVEKYHNHKKQDTKCVCEYCKRIESYNQKEYIKLNIPDEER